MLDWFTFTCGGAALYAAGKLLNAVKSRQKRSKPEQQKKGKFGQPLRLVVAQCEARWFLQELKLAMDGDTEAMVRVSHMLMAGYGTQQDHTAAAQWMRQAWAIQNYKEPGQLHEMLDVRDSAIPALNEANRRPAGSTTGNTAAAAATNVPRVNHASGRIVDTATAADAAAADSKGSIQTAVQSGKGDSVAACQVQQGDAAVQAVAACCMQGLQPDQQQQPKQPQPSVPFQQQQQYNQRQQRQHRQAERENDFVAAKKHCRRAWQEQQQQRAVAAIIAPLQQQQQQQQVVAAATTGATPQQYKAAG